jgi:uncharacterized membrane protein
MKPKRILSVAVISMLVTLPAAAQTAPKLKWHIVDVPGAEATAVTAINASGDIAGQFTRGGIDHGFVYRRGVFDVIDAPEPGTFSTRPMGISERGVVSGLYRYPGACPECPPWVNFQMRGFTWDGGELEVVSVPGSAYSLATGINVHGDIVGEFWMGGKAYGFVKQDGVIAPLDMAGAPEDPLAWSSAYGINANGDVAGWYGNGGTFTVHAYLLRKGKLITIDVPGFTWVIAAALNNQDDVVVQCYRDWAVVANYVWKNGALTLLPQFPGATSTTVAGIADNGAIVGSYTSADGKVHGFVAER